MQSEARVILLPILILGGLIAALGFASWYQISHANPEAEQKGTAPEDGQAWDLPEEDIPAAGLLAVRGEIPEFTFEDETGNDFGLADLLGRVWIADFIYVRCSGPCPAMTVSMKQLQDLTEDHPELTFVTFTVDPDHDSVKDLKRYATNTDADPARWHFLRGDKEGLHAVMIGGFKIGSLENPLNHSTRFCLVDQAGRVRGHYDYKRGDDIIRLRKHASLLMTGERN